MWVNDTDNVLENLTPTYDGDGGTSDTSSGAPIGGATSSLRGISAVGNLDSTNTPGATRLAQDFGYTPTDHTPALGAIGDTIFIDDDQGMGGDSFDPANDTPLEGVEVILTLPSGVTITQKTDENGRYYFGGLDLNESYTVRVDTNTLPGGAGAWSNTADPNGDDNNTST